MMFVCLLILGCIWRQGYGANIDLVEDVIEDVIEEEVAAGGESQPTFADLSGVEIEDLDKFDENGRTPLMNAAWFAHYEAARHLCKAGADLGVRTADGTTALMMAAERGFAQTVTEMVKHCKNVNENVNLVTKRGKSALSAAVVGSFGDVVEQLLKGGADANMVSREEKSLLMAAKTPAVVMHLINSGADPNYADTQGNTALMYAAVLNETDIIHALMDANADPDAKNKIGNTALMFAASRDEVHTIRALAERGASVNIKNRMQESALELALGKGASKECLDTLLEVGANFEGTGLYPSKDVIIKRAAFLEVQRERQT